MSTQPGAIFPFAVTMDDMAAIVKPHNDKIVAEHRLSALIHASKPLADCVEGFSGPDHDYISVTAGELRALAAAIAKAEGRS